MVPLTKSPMIVRHAEALAVVMVYGVRAALRHQAGAGYLIHLLQARANVQGVLITHHNTHRRRA